MGSLPSLHPDSDQLPEMAIYTRALSGGMQNCVTLSLNPVKRGQEPQIGFDVDQISAAAEILFCLVPASVG